jgi:DNA-binding MarR family transcriptional regulator
LIGVCFELEALDATLAVLRNQSKYLEAEATVRVGDATDRQPSTDAAQLCAYFALMEVAGLLRHAVEQQLREAGDLSYVQFQLLARLGLDSPTGSERMTDLADGVVYSRGGLTYQAGFIEKAGLVTRTPSANDERGVTVTITDAGRALLAEVLPATPRCSATDSSSH